jgi:predicted O-methyltransferase YrrM
LNNPSTFVENTFSKSYYATQIEFRLANAIDEILNLENGIDLVFIDADKSNYCNYYNLLISKVKIGGLIIADNVLWSGKVLNPELHLDDDTQNLTQFNTMVSQDNRVENLLVPIRDGLMILRKLAD